MPSQVLIVDDDPMLQRLLGAHLSTAGYQVIETSSGAAGLAVLRNHGPRIAFVDYDMPGMNGIEFCRQVRADLNIPFAHLVILTAHVDRALTIAALDAGANDFMTKPFHRGELLARLRAGERTVRLHDEASQAIKLESERNHLHNAVTILEQFLGVVAHELRKPLETLKSLSQFLLNPANRGNEEWEKNLQQMNQGIQTLSRTINDLMGSAQTSIGNEGWSRFALDPIFAQTIKEITPLLGSNSISISAHIEPHDAGMTGDSVAIHRLLLNLLHNACKFTSTGSIRIEAKAFCRDGHDWIEMQVIDTGSGISQETLNELGQPLILNAAAGGGISPMGARGLGIAICKRIVEAHQGRMKFTSTPGQGANVNIVMRADLAQPVPLESGTIFALQLGNPSALPPRLSLSSEAA